MKIKIMRNSFIKIVIALIFLIIFNVIFFFGDIVHNNITWCSYWFTTFAYICLLTTPLLSRGVNSAILSWSLWLRAGLYFITELVIAIIFMFVELESIKWPLIIQLVLLAIFIVLQLMSVLANDATKTTGLHKQRRESFSRQILIDQLQLKVSEVKDLSIKTILNRCIDTLNNTPIEDFPEAKNAGLEISNSVKKLCIIINENNVSNIKLEADKLINAVQNRNLIVKRCRIR